MINKIKLNSVYDNKKTFIYIAQKEDTVQSLAERFHTTQEVIISLNGLTEDVSKGEYLVIERIDGVEYTVMPCDTVESIAEKFCVNAVDIMLKNKVDVIYVGQKIYV
ncbi:MAG: LysM peptidoglycan-binding domain-containing protein [Clostridiales bacterium]|nr:LysM peptidoglycan-binding domain-containing protein [Clostridiales bacterium]